MKWWDDIWLNEGFATWMANKPVAAWRPDWHVELDDAADRQTALGIDAMRSTRAIRMRVETPAEINEVFDGIAYNKTAAVLRMIEAYVGPDAFRKGVASYLKRFSYANAAGEDFWNEVAKVTGKPVDRILRSMVDLEGAPVLEVETKCVVEKTTEATVTMERFMGTPGAPRETQPWTIPACLRSASGSPHCEVLDRAKQTIRLAGCGQAGQTTGVPPVANVDGRGYYFTAYVPDAVRALAASSTTLTALDRLALLGDEWWMVRAGRHDVDVYLDIAGRFADDRASTVIEAIAGRLTTIGEDLISPSDAHAYQAWIRSQFGLQLAVLGLPGNPKDDDETQTRGATLLELVGNAGNDRDVQRRARELATLYLDDRAAVPGTLAPTVLRVAALGSDHILYDQYVAQLEALAGQPEEYYRVLDALPWFKDPTLVRRTLTYALTSSVRTQDTGRLLGMMIAQPWSQEATWDFVRSNWPTIVKSLGEFQGIPAVVEALGAFCSSSRAGEVREFFEKNPVATSQRGIRQSLDRIDGCVSLRERQQRALANWLAKR